MPVIKRPLDPGGRWPRITRDSILFFMGIIGISHEAFIRDGDPRTQLLIVFASMCGLPAFLRLDENRNKDEDAE